MDNKQKILIVDDERFYINILVELLQHDYKILVAKNGQQALKRIEDNLPDLILLDIVMPDMDGFEVCHRIKQQVRWQEIPIIFLSAATDQETEIKVFNSGAADFINKPISPPTVMRRVQTQLILNKALLYILKGQHKPLNLQTLDAYLDSFEG